MSQPFNTVILRRPYLLFLGEETSPLKAKTAFGLRDWAADSCTGQMHMPGGTVDLGLPEHCQPVGKTGCRTFRQGSGAICALRYLWQSAGHYDPYRKRK